jgi:hypothetical protein
MISTSEKQTIIDASLKMSKSELENEIKSINDTIMKMRSPITISILKEIRIIYEKRLSDLEFPE